MSESTTPPPPSVEALQAQVAELSAANQKLKSDKDFLVMDTNGLRELNTQLQADLDTAISSRVSQVIQLQNDVGRAIFGVPNVTEILNDYSRVGDMLVRTGKIPEDTKTGEIFQALSARHMSELKAEGQLTPSPDPTAPRPDPADTSLAQAPSSSSVSAPVPPPSPEPPAAAAVQPPAPTPPTGPNSGPTVRTIEPPAGGWMQPQKLQ